MTVGEQTTGRLHYCTDRCQGACADKRRRAALTCAAMAHQRGLTPIELKEMLQMLGLAQ